MVQDGREIGASPSLGAPYVTWGRLMQPTGSSWGDSGNHFTGFISADGWSWTKVAEITANLPFKVLAGLAVSSSQARVTTTVMFDHVSLGAK